MNKLLMKNGSLMIFGSIVILALTIVNHMLYPDEPTIRVSIQLILVLLSTYWAVRRAVILNRNKIYWGIFTFLLAPIALISLGLVGARKDQSQGKK